MTAPRRRDPADLLDELRGLFQDRVDDLERLSATHLDRWADRGQRELAAWRDDLELRRERQGRGKASSSRPARARSSSRRARKRSRHAHDLTPAEREHARRLRRARSRANRKLGFLTHFGSYAATLALIFVATRSFRVTAIVALGWGIGVFVHYLWALAAPELRDRWIEDEVGELVPRAVESERRHVETRSRRSMEDLSASIAHEIRNPITAAKSLVQQMGEDPASTENLEYAELALSELDRVERSISHLLRYARDEEPRLEPVSLRAIAESAVGGMRERAAAASVGLEFDFLGEGRVRGDVEKLRRVIENLIANALDAIESTRSEDTTPAAPATRPSRIAVSGGASLSGDEVWLRVRDDGPGVDPAIRERIWSPFFTTRENGTGLGLALSRKTVEAHGGQIELVDGTDAGAEFVLRFPAESAVGEGASSEPAVEAEHGDER